MKTFTVKVYVAQHPEGRILGVKLTFAAAHAIAKANAPARVLVYCADKTTDPNPGQPAYQQVRN